VASSGLTFLSHPAVNRIVFSGLALGNGTTGSSQRPRMGIAAERPVVHLSILVFPFSLSLEDTI
jgi:hypothetical protein